MTFRTLVRFKVFQLMGVSSLVVPLTAVFSNEPVATGTAAAVAAVVGGGYDKDMEALARRHCILHHVAREIFESNKL